MDTPWYIELLGGLQARLPDRTLSRFQTRQAALLLAFLALHPQRPHPRDALADLLWPLADPQSARNRLKVALASLRHQLEPPGVPPGAVLIATRSALQLNPAAATSDVARFEAALQAAARAPSDRERGDRLREAVALYQGELLAGYEEAWVLPERERLATAYLEALGELARLAERGGERGEALRWARQAVAADPVREEGQRELIRLLLAAGEREAARRQYEAFVRRLAAELGGEPEPETRALIGDLPRQTRPVPGGPSTAGSGPGGRRAAPPSSASVPAAPPSSPPVPAATPPAPEPPVLPAAPAGSAADEATPHLPLQFTRFFGRDAELQLLGKLLRSEPGRLVTVMGPGGSGKTRLAIEAAGRLAGDWGGRVWFVSLAEVAEAARLPEAFREGMGLPPSPHLPALEQVASVLGSGPALLLLDNVEHLLPEGAGLLQGLRARLPGLTCLVTSRRRLGLEGERVLLLAPLPVPEETLHAPGSGLGVAGSNTEAGAWSPERLLGYPSVALFVDRAQGVRPDFQVTARNGAAVASLCRRLEGIPLAIELAAARAGVFTLRQMLEDLQAAGTRSVLLTRRGRGAEGRHASLGTALAWSYRLLGAEVQRFFARLSVFRGGWRWEAAAAVCEEERGLEYLEELRECSLVMGEESEEGMRFRMLEPVREFGAEQLSAAEGEALARRHAAYFLALAEEAEAHLTRAEQVEWLERLESEHENLRTSLEWAMEQRETALALRLAGAIWPFWYRRGLWTEARTRSVALLAQVAEQECRPRRAEVLRWTARVARIQGDYATARELAQASLVIARKLADPAKIAAAVNELGRIAADLADLESARVCYEESRQLFQRLGDSAALGELLADLGYLARRRGDSEQSRAFFEESLAIHRATGDLRNSAACLKVLAEHTLQEGDRARALPLLEEALALYRAVGDRYGLADALFYLGGVISLEAGDFEKAQERLEESLTLQRLLGARSRIGACLEQLGRLAYLRGEDETARSLLQESLTIRRQLGRPIQIADSAHLLGLVSLRQERNDEAKALLQEAASLYRQSGNPLAAAQVLIALGRTTSTQKAYEAAEAWIEEGLALARESSNAPAVAIALYTLAEIANNREEHERAWCLYSESLAMRRAMTAGSLTLALHLLHMGDLARRRGEDARAETCLRESLSLWQEIQDPHGQARCLESIAAFAIARGAPDRGIRLFGAAAALRRERDRYLLPCERADQERLLAAARAALGAEAFAATWTAGRALSLEEAFAEALQVLSVP